jgi:hypothetical protein
MRKWPLVAVMLLACGGDLDNPPALLGDCSNCGAAPISGGGISGGSDASSNGFDGGDASFDASLDAIDIVDVGVSSDAGNSSDAIDIVDVGVPNP